MNINMYERYALRDIFLTRESGEYIPLLMDSERVTAKNIATDKIVDWKRYPTPFSIGAVLSEVVMPNQVYMSKLLQDAVSLMRDTRWDRKVFKRHWDITYVNRITTRDEILRLTDELSRQFYYERERALQAKEVHDASMEGMID